MHRHAIFSLFLYFFYFRNASTVVAITGKTATPEGKQASVKVSFKSKKTKKISKYSYVSKVTVAEDKLTMTAEATHANEIVATFNKAVGSDAKVTLKKGTADVANTAKIAEDGKSATITLTGKLSDGTYTVTVVAADQTVTADVVAKNEVLTSFEIGSTLKETVKADSTTGNKATAEISYQALNQYGDKINYKADDKSVTVSIGKVNSVIKACKTSEAGTITVEEIPSMYAIPGQSFTVVIVDTVNNTGVTLNKTAVYGASATAAEFTSAGVYSMNKSAFKDVADGDEVANFELLFTAKDQYGDDMSAEKVATLASEGAIQVTIAGGLTNVKADDKYKVNPKADSGVNVVEIGDKTYFAVPFAAAGSTSKKANAGTYNVTIVNNTKGIVYTGEYTVTSGTIISSIQISAKDTIYAGQDNEMDYVVTDTEGKNVTDYATLKDIKVKNNSKDDKFSWKQNSNGTAKLIYKPLKMTEPTDPTKVAARDYTKSEIRSCTIEANKAESGKLLVKSQTFTVYYQRTPLSVSGLASNAASVTTTGDLDVELKNLVVLDQYQNPYSEGDLKDAYDTIGKDIYVTVAANAKNASVKINGTPVSNTKETTKLTKKIVMTGITDKVKLNFVVVNGATVASRTSDDGVDVTFTSGDARKISGLYVDSVNGGCALRVDGIQNKAILYKCDDSAKGKYGPQYGKDRGEKTSSYTASNGTTYYSVPNNVGSVVVKGIVNGKKVVVDPRQYEFVGADQNGDLHIDGVQSYDLAQKVITETREFKIVVSTDDGPQTITGKVDVSNAPAVAKTISANDVSTDYTVSATGKIFTKTSADALFTMKNQYNTNDNGSALYTYTVESVTVSGDAVTYKKEKVDNGSELSASVLTPYLNGSNNNYLTLDSNVVITGSDAIVAKVVVEGTVDKSDAKDKTASKTITLTITK